MLTRRSLIGAAAMAPLAMSSTAQALVPPEPRIAFRVMREGSEIGTHVLTTERRADGFDVHIAVDLAVRIGPVVVFRYTLRGLERWQGGQVVQAEATTNDDGTAHSMKAERNAQGLWVTSGDVPRYLAPPNALPATHWNVAEMNGPWINPQDGKLLRPSVSAGGMEPVKLADGRTVQARHYTLTGEARLELWYDANERWTALRFKAKDDSLVTYERT